MINLGNYVIKEAVRCHFESDYVVNIYFGNQKWTIRDINLELIPVLKSGSVVEKKCSTNAFKFLFDNNLIIRKYKSEPSNFLENNIFYFENALSSDKLPTSVQKEISNLNLLLIGLGGIGSVIGYGLKLLGVNNFVLIDYDTVQNNNLNRQLLYNNNDIGKHKTTALKKRLENIGFFPKISCIEKKVTTIVDVESILCDNNIDFVVCAADSPHNISNIVSTACHNFAIPMQFGGVGIFTGSWSSVLTKILKATLRPQEISVSTPTKGSISSTNLLISSFILNEFLNYFTFSEDYECNVIYNIDFLKYKIKKERL
ncbi:MAG: ThiF family adenylyltransferase [Candidatus Ancillula sp.]|jgi:hypothetical protein|nr:ThiF family adenylyltransferase [Candidatus Ancillula sp.]